MPSKFVEVSHIEIQHTYGMVYRMRRKSPFTSYYKLSHAIINRFTCVLELLNNSSKSLTYHIFTVCEKTRYVEKLFDGLM